jgi:hypothetical protein
VIPTGAVSDTALVAVRTVSTPRSAEPPPVVALAVSVGPNALMASAAATPSTIPISPPAAPLGQGLTGDLAHDHALCPAQGLERSVRTA